MIQDHSSIPLDTFMGLYGVDSYEDSVPKGYFIDELNTITYGEELRTRDGFDVFLETSPLKKFATYRRQGEVDRTLALIGESIVDLTTGQTILTVSGMTDFAINYYNNRAFISPTNGVTGIPGEFVYIYNGSGAARKAAGNAPSGGFTIQIAQDGYIAAGTHIYAFVYETDSGFVTYPCPAQTYYSNEKSYHINFRNIPIGPPGTVARRLIASRRIIDYDGNIDGYEMFFVPGGRIDDNTTTNLDGVTFYDTDLQFSADYVYDQLEEIPATVFVVPYGQRMCYGGPNHDRNLVYISKPLEPESIHTTAGFITLDPFETEGVKDACEFRDNLYVMKFNKTYTMRDNTYEPSTWKPVTLDTSIGCDVNGIARYWDSTGSKVEFFCVVGATGIWKFNGVYEEVPISRNIKEKIWKRYNIKAINKGQVLFDQERMLFYVLLPLDGVSTPNYILVGNFENGFTFDRIKWHLWNSAIFNPSWLAVDREPNTRRTRLKVAHLSGNIYWQIDNKKNDVNTGIPHHVKFAMIGDATEGITHFGGASFRINGAGTLQIELRGEEDIDFQQIVPLILQASSGKEWHREAFLNTERASLKISLNEAGGYFRLKRINIYANKIYGTRPMTV